MNRDDITKLAREHGKPVQEQNAEVEYLFTLDGVEALLAAEREACAKVCDKYYEVACRFESERRTHHYLVGKGAAICAYKIRARSQQ